MQIDVHIRPGGALAEGILRIVKELTGEWFTEDVAPATRRDLLFHDAICAIEENSVRAFLLFTSHDGAIQISLMGTARARQGQGLGSALLERLAAHAKALGFDEIVVFTVPPASKPTYQPTVDFYRKRGFHIVREYAELWQSGALELRKKLTDSAPRRGHAQL